MYSPHADARRRYLESYNEESLASVANTDAPNDQCEYSKRIVHDPGLHVGELDKKSRYVCQRRDPVHVRNTEPQSSDLDCG